MLYGVDISNWQSGLVPSDLRQSAGKKVDFCICKATEGVDFTDIWCDRFVSDCIDNDILFGFYHFATSGGDARAEAIYFYNECKGYFGKGVPVLDYEVSNANNRNWCEIWLQTVHDLSGVWPMLYISASRCSDYEGSWIPSQCGLWVAGYPYAVDPCMWPATNYYDYYDVTPWEFAAVWQFSSEMVLRGYVGKLDADVAYMDRAAWGKYANAKRVLDKPIATPNPNQNPNPKQQKTIDDLAFETILGEYGRGKERKKLLGENYKAVQERVNELYSIANRVIEGYWGNDEERKTRLEAAGYPYEAVQYIVNMFLSKEWG